VIVCGWCSADTVPDRCSVCGRDPALPWVQRGQEAPTVDVAERRFRAVRQVEQALRLEGQAPTIERLAERMGVSPRTVRRWQADGRSAT
jgi:hypothetical protein